MGLHALVRLHFSEESRYKALGNPAIANTVMKTKIMIPNTIE
jgi:hypothetical protein